MSFGPAPEKQVTECGKLAMETLKSENKKRVLPSWMTDPVNERKVVLVKAPRRRRKMAAVCVGAATRWDSLGPRGRLSSCPDLSVWAGQ